MFNCQTKQLQLSQAESRPRERRDNHVSRATGGIQVKNDGTFFSVTKKAKEDKMGEGEGEGARTTGLQNCSLTLFYCVT